MPHNFINILHKYLQEETLPGVKSQLKMAPAEKLFDKPNIGYKKAAVLILLYYKNQQLSTVLIKRNKYPGVHSGQISFPGGQKEKEDKTLVYTAIRETQEEIGVNLQKIKILGTLTPLYIYVSNFDVLPVVGFLDGIPNFNPDKNEVDSIIEVKIKDFLIEKNVGQFTFNRVGQKIKAPCYVVGNQRIWGATAMIISELAEIVKANSQL